MGQITSNMSYQKSQIICLPFLNASPNDRSTIYSVLNYSLHKIKCSNIYHCFVTFDQPLYQKSVEIVQTCNDDEVKKIHVRLGGFHTLMSYLGYIGYVMVGSGLKEALGVCYAINSVEKNVGW